MEFTTNLHQLLQSVTTSQDSTVLQKSTAILNQHFYKNPQCLRSLVDIATSGNSDVTDEVRQLAAVESRKRVRMFWETCDIQECNIIRNALLERSFCEPNVRIRRALARNIAVIARIDIPKEKWNELVPSVVHRFSSEIVLHREVAVNIFSSLVEIRDLGVLNACANAFDGVCNLISDPQSLNVRVGAIGAITHILDNFGHEKSVFDRIETIVPNAVLVLQQSIESGEVNKTTICFEFFGMLFSTENTVKPESFTQLIVMLVQIFANNTISDEIRVQSANIIVLLPLYHPKLLCSFQVVEPILHHVADIVLEITPEMTAALVSGSQSDVDYDFEDGSDDSPSFLARQIIHTYANYLPGKHVFPSISSKIAQFAQSSNPYARRAAACFIRLIVDGCSDQIEPRVVEFLALLCAQMKDVDSGVRMDACISLGALADMFETDVADHHEQYMALLYACLHDPLPQVVRNSALVLEAVLGALGDKVVKYLPEFMKTFSHLLSSSGDVKIQQSVLGAIGSASISSGKQFAPYFDHFFSTIVQFSTINSEDVEQIRLRGLAISTISYLAQSVGSEIFRPHFEMITMMAMQCIDSSMPHIKQCYFDLLGSLAKIFSKEFLPVAPALAIKLFESINANEEADDEDNEVDDYSTAVAQAKLAGSSVELSGDIRNSPKSGSGVCKIPEAAEAGQDDEEDLDEFYDDESDDENGESRQMSSDESEDEFDGFRGASAIAEEKSSAIDVLGDLFEATREYFPNFEASAKLVSEQLSNYHDNVRLSCVRTLCKFMVTFYLLRCHPHIDASETIPRTWIPGLPLNQEIPADVVAFISSTMPILLQALEDETESDVAADMCDSLQSAIRIAGPSLLAPVGVFDKVCDLVRRILRREHEAQQNSEPEKDDVPDETEDNSDGLAHSDAIFISSAGDLAAAISIAIGPNFAVVGRSILIQLCRYFKKNAGSTERSMVTGCIADICTGMGPGTTEWTDRFMRIILKGMKDVDPNTQSNSCYALGVLIANTTKEIDLNSMLDAVHPLFNSTVGLVVDNACGAVARIEIIAIRMGTANGHIQQAVDIILEKMPLKTDPQEYIPIVDLFNALLNTPEYQSFAHSRLNKIIFVYSHVLAETEQIDKETREKVTTQIRNLSVGPSATTLQEIIVTLEEKYKMAILSVIQ